MAWVPALDDMAWKRASTGRGSMPPQITSFEPHARPPDSFRKPRQGDLILFSQISSIRNEGRHEGDRLWHSDSSYRAVPAKYSLLSGRIVVERGGHTEFADMRAAYDALDVATKAEIEDLVCEHSLMFSRGTLGFTELSDAEREMFRPVRQRLVRTHPVSGRRSLFLSAHAGAIVGWPVPEARAFLRDLVEHATQPRFVYSHKWGQWDLVMWDNRQTMHLVTRFDETQVRDMRRTTVTGDAMTVAQAA